MVLMTERSWQDLGSLLGGAGYTNCYSPAQYESKDSLSEDTHQTDIGIRKCEESLMTPTEATSAPSGPSGLVIFGRMVQKHSYVSGLIIMMVNILSTHLIEGSSVCHLQQKISKNNNVGRRNLITSRGKIFNCLFLQSLDSTLALVAVLAKDSHLFVIVFKKRITFKSLMKPSKITGIM